LARRVRARLTRSEGRRFGLVVGGAFLALTLLFVWRSHDTAAVIAAIPGTLLVLAGLLVPGHLGPAYRGWMALATAISRITTPIFMGLVFFLLMWPLGLARRLFGGNPLVHEDSDGSYWKSRSGDHGDLRRQF